MAGLGVALLAWTQQSIADLSRIAQVQQAVADQRLALAHVQTVDLVTQPEGDERIGELELRWKVVQASPWVPNATPGGVPGPWLLARFETQVSILRVGQPRTEFAVKLLARKRSVPVSMEPAL